MTTLSAERIATLGGGKLYRSFPEATGVAFDSRRVRPGDAFFALPGALTHGIQFADAALEAGAAFIVSDRLHPMGLQVPDAVTCLLALGRHARQQLPTAVIAVTGSAGKTSTKQMIATALGAAASPGNFNTPYALSQVLVDHWLRGNTGDAARLVLELGIDRIGEMATLRELVAPSHGVVTLIAESHLEALGTLDNVAREKFQLLQGISFGLVSAQAAAYLPQEGIGPVITYGLEPDRADRRARLTKSTFTNVTLDYRGVTVKLPYPGPAMARNAVAALALAEELSVPLEAAAGRLAALKLEPGRLNYIDLGELIILDDSYNSNPASARVALELLKTAPGPRTAILGDMLELGPEAEKLHVALGAETLALERVIAVGKLARHLKVSNPELLHFDTLEAAQAYLEDLDLKGTVLLKASRGMRLERLIDTLKMGRSVA